MFRIAPGSLKIWVVICSVILAISYVKAPVEKRFTSCLIVEENFFSLMMPLMIHADNATSEIPWSAFVTRSYHGKSTV